MHRVAIFLLSVLLVACSSSRRDDKHVASAMELIQRHPSWRHFPADEATVKQSIMATLEELSCYDWRTMRAAFVQVTAGEGAYHIETAFKLRTINRYLFNVPDWTSDWGTFGFGGWIGIPERDGRVNELWPLKWGSDGKLRLSGSNFGYNGPNFDAVGEFDYLNKRYGLRNQPR